MDLLRTIVFPFSTVVEKRVLRRLEARLVCTAYRTCTIFFTGFEAVAIFLGNCNTGNEERRKRGKEGGKKSQGNTLTSNEKGRF